MGHYIAYIAREFNFEITTRWTWPVRWKSRRGITHAEVNFFEWICRKVTACISIIWSINFDSVQCNTNCTFIYRDSICDCIYDWSQRNIDDFQIRTRIEGFMDLNLESWTCSSLKAKNMDIAKGGGPCSKPCLNCFLRSKHCALGVHWWIFEGSHHHFLMFLENLRLFQRRKAYFGFIGLKIQYCEFIACSDPKWPRKTL